MHFIHRGMSPVNEDRHTELQHAQGFSHRQQKGTAHIKDKPSTRNPDRLRKANTIKISSDKIVI